MAKVYQSYEDEPLPIRLSHKNNGKKVRDYIRGELQELIDKSRSGTDQFSVYVIECEYPSLTELVEKVNSNYRHPKMSKEEVESRHRFDFSSDAEFDEDSAPDYNPVDNIRWVRYALEADSTFYVGYTNDLVRRIMQHTNGNAAFFTEVFTPKFLREVYWFDKKEDATSAEPRIAEDITTLTNKTRGEMKIGLNEWNREGTRKFAKYS
jgi:predicted GIY-YIG superfamily endonuclease